MFNWLVETGLENRFSSVLSPRIGSPILFVIFLCIVAFVPTPTLSQTIFIDDRPAFNTFLTVNPTSTIIDSSAAFAADPAPATGLAKITRTGTISGNAYQYDVYDIDFSNTPTGTITPGAVGGDIFDLDNVAAEQPVSQGGATGVGSWGADSRFGSGSTRNALLFDFTTTPSGNGIGHFAGEFHDTESSQLPTRTSAQYRVYKAGVLIDSGNIDWVVDDGNTTSHFFGYTADSAAAMFDQIVVIVGDDDIAGNGTGNSERLAADRFTFGQAHGGGTPELTASKSFGTPTHFPDGTFSLPVTITVTNTGEVDINNLQIEDDLADAANFGTAFQSISVAPTITVTDDGNATTAVSPSANGTAFDGDTQPLFFLGTDGLLGTNDSVQVNFTLIADPNAIGAPATLQNTARGSGDDPDGNDVFDDSGDAAGGPGTPIIIIPPTSTPNLSIVKIADDDSDVILGQVIEYTYTVTNTGNITIDNGSIADTHNGSGGVIAVASETLLTDNGVGGDSTDVTTDDGTWSVLAPGDVITFTGSYTVTQNDIDTL